jgi:TonB-dependent starch-binding outer membrane protein SusC
MMETKSLFIFDLEQIDEKYYPKPLTMNEIFTVSRARCYWTIAIVLCCLPFTIGAQVLAHAKISDFQRPQSLPEKERSLSIVLNDLQDHYGISFVYESEVVSEKRVQEPVAYQSRVEATLKEVLEPLGLKFKKINKQTYAISPENGKKTKTEKGSSIRKVKESILSLGDTGAQVSSDAGSWIHAVISVKGLVTDENNFPLPGVNVLVKGTTMGTTTDGNGQYSIEVPGSETVLTFTFIGYASVDVTVGDRREINVALNPDVQYLDEVAVIGYGTVKKSDVTGSVSSIKSDAINSFPTTNVLQALSGRTTGVHVIQTTGAPGAGVSVRIRGTNSIQGGNEPLYVIDGFPFSGSPTNLNNSDIESIEVLKDASATAIYGSRGANGVVMITTKHGKAGQTRVDFESSYSVQTLRKKLDLMNGREYAELANIQAVNENKAPYFTQEEVDNFGEGFDWQDLIFQEAPMQNSSLNISGGNEKTTFSIGGSIFQQEGIIKGSDYNRYSLRTNFNHDISKMFSFNLAASMTHLKTDRRDSGGGARGNSMIGAAISAAPISTPYNDDGTYRVLANEYPFIGPDIRNPLNYINEQFSTVAANVILANAAFLFKPIPELTIKISGGIENRDDRTDNFTTRNFINSDGSASVNTGQFRSLLNENTISYNKIFQDKHSLSAVAGFTYQDFVDTSLGGSGVGFLSDVFETYSLGAAETPGLPSSSYSKAVLMSYLGRVNYVFDDRYLVTASFRTDGASRYTKGSQWGYFPSVALAWRVAEEEFFPANDYLSDLKLRASWGLSGSQAIGAYTTLNQLSAGKTIFGNELHSTFAPGTRLPADLQWETTEQIDVGLEMGLLQDRFHLTADYYIKNTRDLLNTVRLPSSLGFTTTIQNIGEVQNKGFEFGLDAKVATGEFQWDVYGNVSINRNKVVSLYNGEDVLTAFVSVIVLQDNVTILREGQPIGRFYGYEEDGYTDQGKIKYKDLTGDGSVTALDKTYIGDPNPDFIYGFNSTMSYKNFEFHFFVQGSQGNDIFNVSAIPSTLDYGRGLNMPREVLYDHWTPENTDAKYPVISQNSSALVSDRMVEDGSFLRLRNIQLAYNLPVRSFGIQWLRNGQVYVSGQNLITLTKYSWWDPEVNSMGAGAAQGIDHYSYPVPKVITAGLRLGF